jgi:hypothetical protein
MSRTSGDMKNAHTQKRRRRRKEIKDLAALAAARPKPPVQHSRPHKFSKSDISKKGTVHTRRHCPIKECRFSPKRNSKLLQQGLGFSPWISRIGTIRAPPKVKSPSVASPTEAAAKHQFISSHVHVRFRKEESPGAMPPTNP